ncbi:MAG: PTS sugar transporter subunit IIA [Candidatus Omnitrophota bacterium]|nr:PTS sugar transporter subunit IIA [Candidatus Omnitrophota bacterium]
MKVADYLKKDQIDLNLSAVNKKEAIEKLGILLKTSSAVLDYEKFIQDVFTREALSTTGIGHSVAIPHARTPAIKDFVIAFGRISEGLEFDSLDKKPAKLIFLMGTPKKKGLSGYLKMLSALNRRLNKKEFREDILKAVTPKEIIEIFKRTDY